MVATDTVAGGGGLFSLKMGGFGDVTSFDGLQWDEFIYNNGSSTVAGTRILVRGTDGTQYFTDNPLGPIGVWNTRSILFSEVSAWTLFSGSGTATLDSVLNNLDALLFSMDTSVSASGNRESGIDNVQFITAVTTVPEPATIAMLALGIAGMGLVVRRRRKH